ncbi:MAG: succinylglutamate desuccinylase/aspartoacylase family protein, partial [Chlorobiales bacterium]|nr:succinylglutamate desuccinylase/aspartoacylase family protein [Chlorobiales bacterium]
GHYKVRVPVTMDMNGMEVAVWTHVLVGANPGPTLTLLSGLHGNEWLHLGFFRRFVQGFDPGLVSGRILVIPIANAVAFGALSRSVPDQSDSADANRAFPGGTGRRFNWLADQMAATIAAKILPSTDYLLDFHLGIWGVTMGSSVVGTDYSDREVNRKSFDLSLAFGTPLILAARMVGHWPGPKSAQSYAGEVLGVPATGSMLGGAGFDRQLEGQWLDANLQGVYNVMIRLGMLPGEMVLPKRYLVHQGVQRISPNMGGLLVPVNEVETFAREIRAGELLGRVVSPFTLETLEELSVPVDGYLAYWSRQYPIRPGEWAYAVIPKDDAGTRWIDNPLLEQ